MSLSLLITIAVAVIVLAVAGGMTARNGSVRAAVGGIGVAAAVVGLWLTGATDLIVSGIGAIISWFQHTVFTTQVAWGVGLLIGGLILAVVGGLLPKPKGGAAKSPKGGAVQPSAKASAVGAPQQQSVAAKAPVASPKPSKQAKGLDPEDAEIEELLRKRGIM